MPAAPSRPPGRRRGRDRHGRGLRGLLAPPEIPISRARSEVFDDLVRAAAEDLDERWGTQLAEVDFAVQDVPPEPAPDDDELVPLGRLLPGTARSRPRIVLYRRPIELRAHDLEDLADLVHDVVVEQVAELLETDPETIDPGYGGGD